MSEVLQFFKASVLPKIRGLKPLVIGIVISVVLHLVALNIIGKLYFGDGSNAASSVGPETLFLNFNQNNADQSNYDQSKNSQISSDDSESGSVLKEKQETESPKDASKAPVKTVTAKDAKEIEPVLVKSPKASESASDTTIVKQAKLSEHTKLNGETESHSTPEQAQAKAEKHQELNHDKPTTAVIQNVEYLFKKDPKYPPLSKRLREEGTVVIKVLIDEKGYPQEIKVRSSSGHPMLDESALKAVKKWVFKPHVVGGRPEKAWAEIPVMFVLKRR